MSRLGIIFALQFHIYPRCNVCVTKTLITQLLKNGAKSLYIIPFYIFNGQFQLALEDSYVLI